MLIHPDDDRWSSLLARVRHDLYHTAEYVKAEAQRLGAEPVGYLVEDGPRALFVPLLLGASLPDLRSDEPRRDAVSPYGYPGILLTPAGRTEGFADECIDGLLEILRERNACTAFVRLHPFLNADLPQQLRRHRPVETGLTVSIDLGLSTERQWATMRKGHTNAVNRARRAGYRTEIDPPERGFDRFLTVYSETLVRHDASAAYDFGADHLQRLGAMDGAHLALALLNDEVAAAYLFFECNGIVQMHLGGPLAAHMHPSPAHLLIHAIALWAKARGNEVLHLGGGVGGSPSDSLFRFKSGFSPRRHPFFTLRLVTDHVQYATLVDRRAGALSVTSSELLQSDYFPAYRALAKPTSDPE
jgi:hypothetical protein